MIRKSLEPAAYIDRDLFARERDRIFARTWQYVGHVEKVRKAGDYMVVEVEEESLIVIRNDDGGLNAFYNVCAHRATRLLSGEGSRRAISCPYHAWTYDKDGKLTGAPNADAVPGFKVGDYCLKPCRVEDLHGLVFINLDPDCPPIRDVMKGLEEHLKAFSPNLPELTFVHRTEADLATNWKVAVENFSECYHCAIVHKDFFDPRAENGVDASSYRIVPHGPWHMHHAEAFSQDRDRDYANEFAVWWLWPNFAIQSHPGCVLNVRKWTPLDVDRTNVAVDWFYENGTFGAADKGMVEHHAATVFAEDIPIVEGVQKGLTSRSYVPGPLMIDEGKTERSEHAVAAIQDLWRLSMANHA